MKHGAFHIEDSMVETLLSKLDGLRKFPLRLSELEAFMGMPLKRYFNQESHDPTFVHDVGGQGINIGGTPIYHLDWEEDLPTVFELRSQFHARYREAPGSAPPPNARLDPMIDLISISGRYDQRGPPAAPEGTERFEDETYSYLPNHYMIKPLDEGFVSLHLHDLERNTRAHRWVYQVTTERGLYYDRSEVSEVESILISFIDAAESGNMPAFLKAFEEKYKEHREYGIFDIGLRSYNARFFTRESGPHHSDYLEKEGKLTEFLLDTHDRGESKISIPRVFRRLGFETVEIKKDIPSIAPGNVDGGLLYYNRIAPSNDVWRVSSSGFYPYPGGGAEVSIQLDVAKIKVQSFHIVHTIRE